MTPFTLYIAFNGEHRTLIDPASLPKYVQVMGSTPGLRIIRVQDDVPPRDVTEDLLAGVV